MDGIGQVNRDGKFQLFLGIVIGIAVLHYARQIFIPVAVAILLSFLLAPLVRRLTRWRFPNVLAVATTLLFAALVLAVLGWVISAQFVNLAENVPRYQNNLQAKISAVLNVDEDSPFSRAFRSLSDLREEIEEEVQQERERERAPFSPAEETPIPVEVRQQAPGPLQLVRQYSEPLLEPLGTAGLAVVFLVFILLQRNDLRDRMIKLISGGNLNRATEAVDEVSKRISRYLLMHTFINVCYGVPVAVGLYFIGVPNAMLWGILATLLRFIPFIGAWIAAFFPVSLAFAVDPGWTMPLLTIGLILVLELFSNNVLEPWLYGSSTGISAVALIFAALVWTWTWGPIGLFLATPITVCLVVVGKYVPSLGFLNTLLGSEPVLSPEARLYQRMLAMDRDSLHEQAESALAGRSLLDFYDQVLVPALVLAEKDRYAGNLAENRQAFILEGSHELLDDLNEGWAGEPPGEDQPLVLCVPARDPADELAARMLGQVLQENGLRCERLPLNQPVSDIVARIRESRPLAVCLCAIPPGALIATRKLCRQLKRRGVEPLLIAAIWGTREGATVLRQRLGERGPDRVATSIGDTLTQVRKALGEDPRGRQAPPAGESGWRRELKESGLEQVPPEDIYDAICRKLAEVFELPMPLVSLIDRDHEFWRDHLNLSDTARGSPEAEPAIPLHENLGSQGLTVIEDLRDSPWAQETFVTQRGIRFFASAPLLTSEGHAVGQLCVMDTRPREISDKQRWYLAALADLLMRRVEKQLTVGPMPR